MNKIQMALNDNKKVMNLGEHIKVLTERVSKESEQHNLLKEENKNLESEKKELDSVMGLKKTEQSLIEEELSRWSDSLSRKSERIKAQELELFSKAAEVEARLEEKSSLVANDISRYMDSLESMEDVMVHLDKEITKKHQELFAIEYDTEQLTIVLKTQVSEYDKVSSRIRDLENLKEQTKKDNELLLTKQDEYIETNKTELKKVSKLLDDVQAREVIMSRREKSFMVMKARLNKVLQLLYPGQNIDNLI